MLNTFRILCIPPCGLSGDCYAFVTVWIVAASTCRNDFLVASGWRLLRGFACGKHTARSRRVMRGMLSGLANGAESSKDFIASPACATLSPAAGSACISHARSPPRTEAVLIL